MKNSWDRMRCAKEGAYVAKRDYERLMAIAEKKAAREQRQTEADEQAAMYSDPNSMKIEQ